MEKDQNILHDADKATGGDRNEDYGNPRENHERTARLIRAYLMGKYGTYDYPQFNFDADDACMFNILQKIARLMHSPDGS